jgi:RHS repeat-associated protein
MSLSGAKGHPFGSCISIRSFSSTAYRYGFNGKEKEADGTTDNYDFGARIYDGRLGRWMAVDPKSYKYPTLSNYQFTSNSPIFLYDPNGLEIIIYYKGENNEVLSVPYTPGIKPAVNNDFVQKVHEACIYAMNSTTGSSYWTLMSTAKNSATGQSQVVGIIQREIEPAKADVTGPEFVPIDNGVAPNPDKTKENIGTIHWDPDTEMQTVIDGESIESRSGGYQAPSTLLFHEICHALKHARNPKRSNELGTGVGTGKSSNYDNMIDEEIITGPETQYIQEINEYEKSFVPEGQSYFRQATRKNHKGSYPNVNPVGVNDCTQVCDSRYMDGTVDQECDKYIAPERHKEE